MLVCLNRNIILFIVLLSIHIGIILADDNKCSIEHCEKCSEETKCETCKEGYTLNFAQTKCLELIKNSNKQSSSAQNSSGVSKNSSASTSSGSAKKSPASTSSGSAKKSSASTLSGSAKKSSVSTSSGSAKKSSVSTSSGSAKKSSSTPSGSAKKSSSSNKSSSSTQKSSNSRSSKKSSQVNPSGSTKKSSATTSSGKNSNTSVNKASNAPIASNKAFQSAFEGKLEEEKSYTSIIFKVAIFCVVGIIIYFCIKIIKKRKNKVGYFYDESGNPEEKAKVVYIQ